VKHAACLALALTLCAVGMSRAEDKTPPGNYEHLKKLEPLIGTWTGAWDSSQDRPTAGLKKGEKLTLTVTWKWEVNKSAILLRYTIGRPESAPVWGSTWLIGWDTANKRIVCISFEATGGHARVDEWEIQGDKVSFKGKGSLPAGNKTAFTMVFSDIKKDSCVTQMIDLMYDGKKQPDLHYKVALKRAQAR
jgi:hypothetical protein